KGAFAKRQAGSTLEYLNTGTAKMDDRVVLHTENIEIAKFYKGYLNIHQCCEVNMGTLRA
ncbi:hypothetical protein J6590_100281, partial [Homalodisca vitripennis]